MAGRLGMVGVRRRACAAALSAVVGLSAVVLWGGMACVAAEEQSGAGGDANQLIAADRGVWEAIAGAKPDLARVEKALGPDYVDIDGGVVSPRDKVIEYLRGLSQFSFRYEHARASLLSPTAGYVIAELTYTSMESGKPAKGKVLTTSVFRKEHGKWIAHLHTEMEMKP